ncbi:hypothetical protein [Streptomyces sp. NPDC001889]
MGSLRNPIGPLPSSIYWRRRAIALALAALLLLLGIWALSTRGGGGGDDDNANGASSRAPSTIEPGPSRSGPAISEQPGGREDSGGPDSGTSPGAGDGTGPGGPGSGSTGPGGGANGGSGGGPGGDSDGGSGGPGGSGDSGTEGSGGSGGGAGSGGPAGQRVRAGSPLPDCPSGALELTLTTRNDYAPDQKPSFRLNARNTSATDCKADLGPAGAVLTIRDNAAEEVWSSKDCPRPGGSLLLRVPAQATITHTVEWDRRMSEPRCATPPAGAVPAGTYLVELRFPGEPMSQRSFVLKKD